MRFVIPSSKNKRYLSGADWIISTLDYIMKTATCAGNMSQIVLMLDSSIEQTELQNHLSQFIKEFPVVQGSIARDFNLAPYWRIPKNAETDLNFNVYQVNDFSLQGNASSLLEKSVKIGRASCRERV